MPWVTLLHRRAPEVPYSDQELRKEGVKVLEKGVIKVGPPDGKAIKVYVLDVRIEQFGLAARVVMPPTIKYTGVAAALGYFLTGFWTPHSNDLWWYLFGVLIAGSIVGLHYALIYALWRRPAKKKAQQLRRDHLTVISDKEIAHE